MSAIAKTRNERARERVIAQLTTHRAMKAEDFDPGERRQLREMEHDGLIEYTGEMWMLARLETFREKLEAELARTVPGADPKLSALGAFARASDLSPAAEPKFTGWTIGLEVDKPGLSILKVALEAQLVISESHPATLARVRDMLEQLDRVRS